MGEFTVIENPSNEALALQAQAGCRASFAELVARFQVPLLHFLRQRTGGLHDAEDLTQDVFVRAFRSLSRYESRWKFSTWLYTIAHRLSLNARRRWRPPVDRRGLEAVSASGTGPEDTLSTAEESSRLWRAAASVLTAEQLTSLWLFYVEEMPVEEIARVLGRSAGATKGLLFRGRRKLAESLGSVYGEASVFGESREFGESSVLGEVGVAVASESAALGDFGRGDLGHGDVDHESLASTVKRRAWKHSGSGRPAGAKRNETAIDPPQPVDATLFKLLPPRLAAELYDG